MRTEREKSRMRKAFQRKLDREYKASRRMAKIQRRIARLQLRKARLLYHNQEMIRKPKL